MTDAPYRCFARAATGLFRVLDLRIDVVGAELIPAVGGGAVMEQVDSAIRAIFDV